MQPWEATKKVAITIELIMLVAKNSRQKSDHVSIAKILKPTKEIPGSAVRNKKLANGTLINFILIGHSLHIKLFSLNAFSLFLFASSPSLNIAFYSWNKSKCALLTSKSVRRSFRLSNHLEWNWLHKWTLERFFFAFIRKSRRELELDKEKAKSRNFLHFFSFVRVFFSKHSFVWDRSLVELAKEKEG